MGKLPSDSKERKEIPIGTGVLDYFPDALAEVAKVSRIGNLQHGLGDGTTLTWDRSKSIDESDALIRHYLERYKVDTDGMLHAAKMAWRSLAFLQKLIEANRKQKLEDDTIAYYEKVSTWDKNKDQNASCICGHPYYRHFDTHDDMYPIGCKYCDCITWTKPEEVAVK